MGRIGRPTNISKGKDPPKPNDVRSKKSRTKRREIKFAQFYYRAEALLMRNIARAGLEGHLYGMTSGARLEPRADADHEAARRIWEEVLQDTEWAATGGEPPDGWIPAKWR
jgi:hypothetical protein